MRSELLEKLLDAGFTKDEILQLARDEPIISDGGKKNEETDDPGIGTPGNENDPGIKDEPDVKDNPGNTNDPDDKTKQNDNPGNAFESRLSGIEKGLTDLMKVIQTSNIKRDSFDSPSESLDDETDKIMKSIIRPEVRKDD